MHLTGGLRRFVVLAVLAVASLAGCTDGEEAAPATSSTTVPEPSTLLRVGVEEWPSCLNPLTCVDDALVHQVLQHVLPVAFELGGDGEYQPSALLASTPEPEATEGGVSIRYEIAEAARWADGRPITSSDFLGTWRAVMDTPGADRTRYDRIVDVDDSDPRVAVVELDGPMVDWQELFGGATGHVLQADAFGPSTDLTGRFADELPMSAGPYQLARWSETRAVLTAVQPWEGSVEPPIDQVRIDRVALEGLEQVSMYDILVPGSTSVDVPDGFERRRTPSTEVLGVWLDQRAPLLQPLVHRQIVDVALDRSDLAEEARGVASVSCPGWIPGIGPWCDAGEVTPPETNRDLAAFVLFEQGWLADESGVLVRNGERFEIRLTHDPAVPGAAAVASAIETTLTDLGIAVAPAELDGVEWRSDRPPEGTTGIGVFAVDLGVSPRVDDLYGCSEGPNSSVVGACPDDLVGWARGLGAMAETDAVEVVGDIAARVGEEVLWLPLAQLGDVSFVRDARLIVPDPVPAGGGPLHGLHRFDVADG